MKANPVPPLRINFVNLLIAFALVVFFNGDSMATALKTAVGVSTKSNQPLGIYHDHIGRHLRTDLRPVNGDEEERGLDSIPGVAKLMEKLRPTQQQTADKLCTRLKLDKTASNVFESPKFQKWVGSVTKSYKETPEAANAAMVATLTSQFGDEAVAKMLATAQNRLSTRTLASKLEDVQFSNWVAEGKKADDAFKLLKLDQEAGDLLANPALNTWLMYVRVLKKNPYESLLSKLNTRYDEEGLASLLILAREDSRTTNIAKKLEETQLKEWLGQKKPADSVFKLLKLDKAGDRLFESPLLSTWTSYLAKLDASSPERAALSVLKTRFSDEAIAAMLVTAKKEGGTSSIAAKLERVQHQTWVSEGKTADDVFTILRLNKDGDKFLDSPMFWPWVSFATKLNEKNPDEVMLVALKRRFSDKSLEGIVAAVKQGENPKPIVNRLRQELWISQGQSADDVFRLLKLDKEWDRILESLELGTWVSYVTKLIKRGDTADEFLAAIKCIDHALAAL